VVTAAEVSSSSTSSIDGQAAAAGAEDAEVAALKQQLLLQVQQHQPAATAAGSFSPDLDSLEIAGAFDMTVVQQVGSGDDAANSISKTAPAAAL
jgi:hypothetical protein